MKWDGARCMCVWVSATQRVRLFSRHGTDLTSGFPEVAADLRAALAGRGDLILDGELVTPDRRGRPVFGRLQRRLGVAKPTSRLLREVSASWYAFDLLVEEGVDVRLLPYVERRRRLEQLPLTGRHLACPPSFDTDIDTVLAIAAEGDLEGVVCKRASSLYRAGRSTAWVKLPLRRRAELVVGGWLPASGSRGAAVGALLLGAHAPDGSLVYVGGVGTGFSANDRRRLATRLHQLHCESSPFASLPAEEQFARWVTPTLVGAVEYREFTSRRLRHPSWKGERSAEDGPLPIEVTLDSLS